jgi:hypothetical protein
MASVHRVAYRLTNHDAGWTSNGQPSVYKLGPMRPYERILKSFRISDNGTLLRGEPWCS